MFTHKVQITIDDRRIVEVMIPTWTLAKLIEYVKNLE